MSTSASVQQAWCIRCDGGGQLRHEAVGRHLLHDGIHGGAAHEQGANLTDIVHMTGDSLQLYAYACLHRVPTVNQGRAPCPNLHHPQALFTSYNFQCPLLVGLLQMAIIVPVRVQSGRETLVSSCSRAMCGYCRTLRSHAVMPNRAPWSRCAMRWRVRGWRRRRSVPWCRWLS